MTRNKKLGTICLLVYAINFIIGINGHGRLMDPPARNSMWRYGFPNPVNYNDNELYCGGFVVQYQKNGGKCGVCGDNWVEEVPRSHEAGGIYGNGYIGRTYFAGQDIEIEAELTTNHKGWMEVKLCVNNDPNQVITQDCLDRYPLELSDGSGPRFIIPEDSKKTETFRWHVRLPDVTCTQCVIQWKYFAGNTWGSCNNGTDSVGCGNQETFINCADISIITSTPSFPSNHIDQIDNPWLLYFRGADLNGATRGVMTPNGELIPLIVRSQVCFAVDSFKELDHWCFTNCLKYPPNCPAEVCRCPTECTAINDFGKIQDADIWCHQHCLRNPSNCPKEKCSCI